MKHSNNNRVAQTLHKYVNNGTSAKVTSSGGNFFYEPISRGQSFLKTCLLGMYSHFYFSLRSFPKSSQIAELS